jgi:hypothetical protein
MAKVYYRRLVEGAATPALIHNGDYHLIDMPVYEDGTIDCWERAALKDVERKIEEDWLAVSVPDGACLSVGGLGAFLVQNGRWKHTAESYATLVRDMVKSMNSTMAGLFEETEEQAKKWEDSRVTWTTAGRPYKVAGTFGYDMTDGVSTHVFTRIDGALYVDVLTGFADGSWQSDCLGSVTGAEIKDVQEQKRLFYTPPLGVPIHLGGLGTIEISEIVWSVDPGEKVKELLEYPHRAGKKATAHDACVAAYHAYLEHPGEHSREALRAAYEAVPEHERMYLGDMDCRDSDYIRILCRPYDKRAV